LSNEGSVDVYWLANLLAQPFLICYVLTLSTLACALRGREGRRWRVFFCAAALTLLTICCMPAVAWLALGSLEWRYPPGSVSADSAKVIVALAGSLRPADDGSEKFQLADDSLDRCVHAVRIYRANPSRTIIVSGGKVDPTFTGPTLASAMREFLISVGIPAEKILVEDRSRTTYENAAETAKILRKRGVQQIVLVTEAAHMWRADGCFRKVGLDVIPSGCNYRAGRQDWSLDDFLPSPYAAEHVDLVAHEWIGIAWYWLHGRI
jgi:uncharacterized SAM-binding protein YcdF (DUF218 family)